MAKARCFISDTYDPFFNLATEDWIFNCLDPTEHILFLWRNNPTVVIGRNQNPWAECDIKKISENNVQLVRRQSGGGAVFQDLGNTNFTFLSSREDYDRKKNFEIIIKSLSKLGINAQTSGRNDILVDGKKISGSAFKENPDRAFHHGTLLINVNLNELAQYLTPSPKKLIKHGTTSVKSRVINLVEFNKELTHQILIDSIIDEFFSMYKAEKKVEVLNNKDLQNITKLNDYYQFLKSDNWRFGETPKFQQQLTEHFAWATIDMHLDTEEGKIKKVKIFSDCLDTQLIEETERAIEGLKYNSKSITEKLEILKQTMPHADSQIQDFQNWISNQIT